MTSTRKFHPSKATALALACAATLAVAGHARAQSSVQAYGLLDVSAGQFQNAGAAKVKRLDSGNLSTSFIGFRGSEDLGGGLRANFALESFLLVDSGNATRVPGVDTYWARYAFVGLSGGFGTLRLGRMGPPLFISSLLFNAYGDSFGYSPTIRQYYNAPYGTPLVGDSGWNNAIGYTTPGLGGATGTVMVAAGEGASNARGPNVGANVVWFGGDAGFTAAWQKVEAQGTLGRAISAFPGFESQSAWQVGGSYDFKFVNFYAQVGRIETKATRKVEVDNVHLSASVPLGNGAILAAYGMSEIETATVALVPESKMATLGYDYKLSKRTDVYALWMGDKYTGLRSGNTYAVGLRHTF